MEIPVLQSLLKNDCCIRCPKYNFWKLFSKDVGSQGRASFEQIQNKYCSKYKGFISICNMKSSPKANTKEFTYLLKMYQCRP